MIETGVVIGKNGNPMYWHLPRGRSGGHLPDSRDLWDVLWATFKVGNLQGFAHSHPGNGYPSPSLTDTTTFAAIEAALGCRLDWWITSADHVVLVKWCDYIIGDPQYVTTLQEHLPPWVDELRRLSTQEEQI